MGQIVFQATLGGQTALVGQNTSSSYSLNLPLATDTLVGKATTDTLTNKTLTLPVISSIVNTGTLTLPTSTDTLVGRVTTDTLTNKTISGSSNTLSNIGNSSLTNSSLTIGSTAISLGATATTVSGLTLTSPTINQINTSVANTSLGAGNASIMKNRIINGAMVIDQRNSGASVTITNTGAVTYTLDRWFAYASVASKFSVQQNAGSVTLPVGFNNYLGVTSLSAYSIGAGDIFEIGQSVEGFNFADLNWGTANAKTVTLSFQVYSSLTGTFGGALKNSANNRTYPFSYSIPVANTWTSISVTIAGDTTGTWIGATNGVGVQLCFGLGVGSTGSGAAGTWSSTNYTSATGATSVVGTSGATFYITGVQLEVGSSATGYEYRNYGTELNMCQRYYEVMSNGGPYAGLIGWIPSTTLIRTGVFFKVTKRATPTVTAPTTNVTINSSTANYTPTSTSVPGQSIDGAGIEFSFSGTPAVVGTAASISILASNPITISAEL